MGSFLEGTGNATGTPARFWGFPLGNPAFLGVPLVILGISPGNPVKFFGGSLQKTHMGGSFKRCVIHGMTIGWKTTQRDVVFNHMG